MNIKNISFGYSNRPIFDNFSLSIKSGKVTVILGPSGCGKTTLLNIISGLIKPDKGAIDISSKTEISYVFQEPRLLSWKSVEKNILLVLETLSDKEQKQRCSYYLKAFGMYDFKDYYPDELSGGMKQRSAIARAFAYPSNTILMDEPFIGLDLNLKISIFNLFNKIWREEERTAIFVTHNIHDALLLGDEIVILSKEPTLIKEHISNPIPHNNRSLSDPLMMSIENKLYNALT